MTGGALFPSRQRQPHIVLRQRRRRRPLACHHVQLRQLPAQVEVARVWEAVEHRGHPPGEVLGAPDAAERRGRVGLEQVGRARAVVGGERPGEDVDVGGGEVETLGAGGRDGVGGVAGEEQAAVLHRLADEAAHRDDAFLEDLALLEPEALALGPGLQLRPDPVVGPVVGRVVRVALEVETLDAGRAGADQREAALVAGVDQLVRGGRRLGEDAEPAERVDAEVVVADGALGHGGPADAVAAVAAGDEIADELSGLALLGRAGDPRPVRGDAGDAGRLGLEQDLAARVEAELDEVLQHLVLGVDGDRAAAGEAVEVDAVAATGEAQLDAVVDEALALEALAGPDLAHQVDRALLQHAGPDRGLDRRARAALDDDRLDAAQVEHLREQQPRRPGADDADLGAHGGPSRAQWAATGAAWATIGGVWRRTMARPTKVRAIVAATMPK